MKKIHPEFAFQSRELGAQIEDTLGDPPNKKYYARVVKSLIGEYVNGSGIDDVNLLSFALAEHIRFDDPAGLLSQSERYDSGDAAKVFKMVSCKDDDTNKALTAVFSANPELARKAVITAFLFKNRQRWSDEDHTLESLQKEEDEQADREDEDEDEAQLAPGQDVMDLFDSRGDGND